MESKVLSTHSPLEPEISEGNPNPHASTVKPHKPKKVEIVLDESRLSFVGPDFDATSAITSLLPVDLIQLLQQKNGVVLYEGGLHVRGLCSAPGWHSLEEAMCGAGALHKLYPEVVLPSDVPFAQDCVAVQYILREDSVWKLDSETGALTCLHIGLAEFFQAVKEDPIEFLELFPLVQFQRDGGSLEPGQVLHVYPPFCTSQSANGNVSLKSVPVAEALAFLADFSRQLASVRDGENIELSVASL